jgi:hypothetical protein
MISRYIPDTAAVGPPFILAQYDVNELVDAVMPNAVHQNGFVVLRNELIQVSVPVNKSYFKLLERCNVIEQRLQQNSIPALTLEEKGTLTTTRATYSRHLRFMLLTQIFIHVEDSHSFTRDSLISLLNVISFTIYLVCSIEFCKHACVFITGW